MMRTYAHIQNGVNVIDVSDWNVDPQLFIDTGWVMIDVTDIDPKPGVQWTYDGSVFTAPPQPEIPVYDPRPDLEVELANVNSASISSLRSLVLSATDVGLGTPERSELENLEAQAKVIRLQLETLNT